MTDPAASSSPPNPSETAQRVGEFILGRTLGTGATGKVKLGTHAVTGVQVAIKIVPKDSLDAKPQMRRKLEREVAVLRMVAHPNVMSLYDVYETSRYVFLILEYVPGGELFDHLVVSGVRARAHATVAGLGC